MTEILRERLDVPSNWRGAELVHRSDRVQRLSPEETADLEEGLAAAPGAVRLQ